jgi:hypothetical protein
MADAACEGSWSECSTDCRQSFESACAEAMSCFNDHCSRIATGAVRRCERGEGACSDGEAGLVALAVMVCFVAVATSMASVAVCYNRRRRMKQKDRASPSSDHQRRAAAVPLAAATHSRMVLSQDGITTLHQESTGPLPHGWKRVTSMSTGGVYYYNMSTGVCTFTHPDSAANDASSSLQDHDRCSSGTCTVTRTAAAAAALGHAEGVPPTPSTPPLAGTKRAKSDDLDEETWRLNTASVDAAEHAAEQAAVAELELRARNGGVRSRPRRNSFGHDDAGLHAIQEAHLMAAGNLSPRSSSAAPGGSPRERRRRHSLEHDEPALRCGNLHRYPLFCYPLFETKRSLDLSRQAHDKRKEN